MWRVCTKNLRKVHTLHPWARCCFTKVLGSPDSDELLPVQGKDEDYDAILEETRELEETLEVELKKLEKKVGWVTGSIRTSVKPGSDLTAEHL